MVFLFACLAIVAFAPPGFAEDYHAVVSNREDTFNPFWDWTNPKCWVNSAGKKGVPTTVADVGIIGNGMRLANFAPLGSANNRPTIRVEKGGALWIGRDTENPVILAGGIIDGQWIGRSLVAPVTITEDSTFAGRDEWGNWELSVRGPVSNSKPVTLHISGMVAWRTDCSKTFSGAIDIDRGAIGIDAAPMSSGIAGTGPIQLGDETMLMFIQWANIVRYLVPNALSGNGTIMAGNMYPQNIVVFSGQSLHPGVGHQPGTLCVRAGSFEFRRKAGKPVEFVVEVQGDGSNPKADYGQLALFGNLANSLDNADLILRLKPDMTPEQAAALKLNIITTQRNEATRLNLQYQPFHSVQVIAGNRTGSATVNVIPDPMTEGYDVQVSNIVLK